jgi:hypothetical protein
MIASSGTGPSTSRQRLGVLVARHRFRQRVVGDTLGLMGGL